MTVKDTVLCLRFGNQRKTFYIHMLIFLLLLLIHVTTPVPVNVALNKPVTALYTCGTFGKENFNTLSDVYRAVSDRPRHTCESIRPSNGGVTSNQSPLKKPDYPPEAMVDGKLDTYWQSVSRSRIYLNGQELKIELTKELEAMIDIDLFQEFHVENISIQLGDALTPQKVSIQKSLDGQTFRSWIYAVSNLDDCSTFFQTTIKSVPTSLTDTICVGYVANDQPPGDVIAADLSKVTVALKEWQRVRYLKIKFYDMLFVYPYNSLANSFNHYSIQEVTVMAECPCNGQQEGCQVSQTTGMYECICGGNTRGRFCESCLPLFNQFPFEYGQSCEACNCFEHATSCFYQASVEAEGLSLDKDGNRRGGGVCTDCQHNTAGINCEKCAALYYRPVGRLQTAVDACVLCQCNASGSAVNPDTNLVDCVMNNDQPSPDGKVPGDCYCKANVQGSSCDICKSGFYNLQQSNPDGCTACDCHTPGTAGGSEQCSADINGQCSCKTNVEGRACDQCKDGFYGLDEGDVSGCKICDCDVGGALNQVCDKETGQCVCRSENIIGRRCDGVHPNFYYPTPHGISVELEDSLGHIVTKRDPQNAGFSGRGYAVVTNGSSIYSLLTIPVRTDLSNDFILIVRYRTSQAANISIQLLAADNDSSIPLPLPICASSWCEVNTATGDPVYLTSGPNLVSFTVTSGQALLDKLVALPVEYLHTDEVLPYSLPAGCDLLKNARPSDPAEATVCWGAIFSLTMYYLRAPLPCNCDLTGSISPTCNVSGGQCQCQPSVVGRTCDRCSADHFGFSSTGCSDCNCDEFSSDCDSVTGQCQCPENTMGRQCEFCVPNTWGWNKTTGCKPCECNSMGSLSPQCNATHGICMCRIGVEGAKCDRCQDGFYNLTSQGCLPCSCNEAGSVGQTCNKTSGQCECKDNTGGRQCDSCLPGTFGLHANNTGGCLDCVCMGITTECVSAGIRLSSELFQLSRRTDTGVISALNLVQEDDSVFNKSVRFDTNADGTTAAVVDLLDTDPRLYWEMPTVLVSNLLSVYGSNIKFTVNFVIVDGQVLTDDKALLIYGSRNTLEYPLNNVMQGVDSSHVIALRESEWQNVGTGTAPTRGEFLRALSSATGLLLPASFGSGKHTSRLSRLEFSAVSSVGPVHPPVEQCVCGTEYTGRSCQSCTPGYRRENVSSSDYFGVCVACECNGHTALCDPNTAVCQDCIHHTTGDSCEVCLPGFYGDATAGTESDCTECPCYYPRVMNATCEQATNSTDVVCAFCQDGYIGIHCDACDLLFYGNPQSVNGTCLPCECHGNSDSCNSVTGICDSCSFNTTGNNCESCVTGFYGNATLQDCQECECLPSASNSTICDSMSGQCACVYGVGGRTCDHCLMGFWGYHSTEFVGCKACGCLEAGSVSVQCANETGLCSCKANTKGTTCEECEDGFYGLPAVPCQACGCDPTGSVNVTFCDKVTGQCACQPGVSGRQCDQCLPFFVNFTDTGCEECGQCQKALGDNVQAQLRVGEELLNRTLQVQNVQLQDLRLQNLTARLNQSRDSLGLAGSSATSIEDIVGNVTNIQDSLVSSFGITETKVSSLSLSVHIAKNKSSDEVTRHANMADLAVNLTSDINSFGKTLDYYLLYMNEYNSTASQYLNRGGQIGNGTLTFQGEMDIAASLLTQAQNTSALEAVIGLVNQQASDVTAVSNSTTSLVTGFNTATLRVMNLSIALNAQSYNTATVENTLGQAAVFRSQVEDLRNAVNTGLNNTENRNQESVSALAAARTAVRNTNSVYNGNALLVMTGGEFLPFPSDVSNFETGSIKLKNLHASIPLLIDRVATAVNQSEIHVALLDEALVLLRSTYQNISSVGTEAVQAIEDFEQVVKDIDTAASTVTTANQLIEEVRGNITGANLERLEQEYAAEKGSAEAWRLELMGVDYQPQVLQNALDTAGTNLDNENTQWAQADIELNAMRAAAQTLHTQIQDNVLSEQLATSINQVSEALTTAQTVAASVASQDEVVRQKQAELGLIQGQLAQTQQLDVAVRQRITAYQTRHDDFQKDLTSATTLSQQVMQKTSDIADKIQLLESKLANAESMLTQLRQPVSFDGSLGLELRNSMANEAHLYDDVVVEMRKPANFTDGVVLFLDNPATSAELEVGLLNDQVFFEFNTGAQSTRVTSPAEICDNCWTRIVASRYGTVGHLMVTMLSTGGVVSNSVRGQGAVTAGTLTLTSDLFVGSLPDTEQTTKVTNRMFRGCLHNLKYQDEQLSLWTAPTASNQGAKCCPSPPSPPEPSRTPGASFTGFGYLVLSPGSLQFSQTQQLNMQFRTFSVNATLLKVVSADAKTYVSFHLLEGYVVWETLSGGLLHTVRSQSQFATGRWVQIIAESVATEFKLSVKYVDDSGSPEVTTLTISFGILSPLDGQNIIIGSASDPSSVGYTPGDTNFAGCLRQISITTPTATTQLSFTDNVVTSSGVSTDGCYEQIISGLSLTSELSFAQLAAIEQIQQLGALEFDIITNQLNGMLMYIAAPGGIRFLYVALFGGNVIIVYRQDTTAVVVSSGHYVSDGQLHTIKLDCRTRRVSLKVDGAVFEEPAQTLSVTYLAFSASAVMQLGAISTSTQLQPECPVKHSLIGGITRLVVNTRSIAFTHSNIVEAKDVSLAGIFAPASNPPVPPVTTQLPPQGCASAPTPAYLDPSQGITMTGKTDINWSQLLNTVSLVEYFERSSVLSLDFAAFKADGVLLYMADLLQSPAHYLTLYMLNGMIHLRLRTNLTKEYDVTLTKPYNDGQRHQLKMMRINDFASMETGVEKDYVNTGADSNVHSRLAIASSTNVTVGGIGLNNLSTSPLPQEFKTQPTRVVFAGAIYSLQVGSEGSTPANVTLPISILDRSVFPAVPRDVRYGVSLSGVNSYLYLGRVITPLNFKLEMTFSTVSDSGLFFLIDRNISSRYLAMDMNMQELRLHLCPSYDGVIEPLMLVLYKSTNLCDGQPHTVLLQIRDNTATATVDGSVGTSLFVPASHALSMFYDADFYIGGYTGLSPALPSSLNRASLTGCVMSVILSTTPQATDTKFDPTQYAASSAGASYSCPY